VEIIGIGRHAVSCLALPASKCIIRSGHPSGWYFRVVETG
jgi:hypothetical protein